MAIFGLLRQNNLAAFKPRYRSFLIYFISECIIFDHTTFILGYRSQAFFNYPESLKAASTNSEYVLHGVVFLSLSVSIPSYFVLKYCINTYKIRKKHLSRFITSYLIYFNSSIWKVYGIFAEIFF